MTRIHLFSTLIAAIGWSYLSPFPQADEGPARRIGVIIEGTFEKPEITAPIENARKTQIVAYYEWDFGVRPFTNDVWSERGLSWESLMPVARTLADGLAEKIEPTLVRDDRGVILYATITGKDPFLTSVVFSSELLDRFRETLGDRIQVVLLDRHKIYLFPATGGQLEDFGPALVKEFVQTPFPVSLEVFLLDDRGFSVIGELERAAPTN